VDNLRELLEHLQGFSAVGPLAPARPRVRRMTADFSEVRGQQNAKRALEVAAAGGHNVLLIGPPGSGKTMLAKRLPGVLPEMTFDESLETTKIYSVTGLLAEADALVVDRPFRAPHHTISDGGLIGGGSIPRPGEVSLAHHGVLFLDELPEFKRSVLEVMRQPLEEGQVTLARAATRLTYPARAMLVAAMNPCPCGHLGDPLQPCRCLPVHVEKYRARVSGPLLDRIDLHVDVPAVRYRELAGQTPEESSDAVRRRVDAARAIQLQRFQGLPGMRCNAQMGVKEVRQFCRVGPDGEKLLARVVDGLGMSARAYDRILKVARTLADLAGQTDISTAQLAEAIQYRSLDRRLATH
jgi:magnesium chelatase family protein